MKKFHLFFCLCIGALSFVSAQKPQRIAYVDMAYILENIPNYITAQNALDAKVKKWQKNLDKEARFIEVLKTDLANEKAILTPELIEEREEDILLKQEELRRLEEVYFGPKGDMYFIRMQLIKPVQDQVYNAVQAIAAQKKYDIVFDKSNDLVMLYSNKKYDISNLVIKSITRSEKRQLKKDEIAAKAQEKKEKKLSPAQQKKLADKEASKAAKLAKRAEQKKAIEAKRKQRLKDREAKRLLLKQQQEASETTTENK